MLRGRTPGCTQCRAQHHRHLELAAGHIVGLGRLVDELVHRQRDKVAEHNVHNRAHPGDRGTNTEASNTRFGDGRIDDALCAEFIDHAGEHFEDGAGFSHILADDKDARIAAHLFADRLADCFGEG